MKKRNPILTVVIVLVALLVITEAIVLLRDARSHSDEKPVSKDEFVLKYDRYIGQLTDEEIDRFLEENDIYGLSEEEIIQLIERFISYGKELISSDEFRKMFEITMEDMKDTDIKEFIQRYQITPENINGMDIMKLLESYREELRFDELYNTHHENTGGYSADDMALIGISVESGNETDMYLIDLAHGYATYSHMDIEDLMSGTGSRMITLTDNEISALRQAVDIAGTVGWETEASDDTAGSEDNWIIYISFSDNTVNFYSGSDLAEPAGLRGLIDDINSILGIGPDTMR